MGVGYMKTEETESATAEAAARMAHQRLGPVSGPDSEAHHVRGIVAEEPVQKFRKGACENCGAMTHRTKECLERPRRLGARWTGQDIQPDEYVQEAALGFEGKRDRWAGYNADEYVEVVDQWQRQDEERKAFLKQQHEQGGPAGQETQRGGVEGEGLEQGGKQREAEGEEEEEEEEGEKEEEQQQEKYADFVDMPGQKVDLKTRMTVRNLRLREDTAKYLEDLNADPSQYDPKTRSMRKPVVSREAFVPENELQAREFLFSWELAGQQLNAARRGAGGGAGGLDDVEGHPGEVARKRDEVARKRAKLDPHVLQAYGSEASPTAPSQSRSSPALDKDDDLL